MKFPQFLPKKNHRKLEVAARRAPRDVQEMEEPNMRLSSAFVVVLVLHLVAVGGIYAFNSIKAHRAPDVDPNYRPAVKSTTLAKAEAASKIEPAAMTTAQTSRTHRVKTGETLAQIAALTHSSVDDLVHANALKDGNAVRAGQELKIPIETVTPAKPAEKKPGGSPAIQSAMVRDSGQTYIVAKGDNPLTIARKFGVNQEEMLKLNKVDDPKKLQIGTKLRLPVKSKTK
jgi:LysM repeat protein